MATRQTNIIGADSAELSALQLTIWPDGSSGNVSPTHIPDAVAAFPYDLETMTHELEVVGANGYVRKVSRPVARNYGEAVKLGYDYWHPGGIIKDDNGKPLGSRTRSGWFLHGRKWQNEEHEWANVNVYLPTAPAQ